jgi:hypothetical protein
MLFEEAAALLLLAADLGLKLFYAGVSALEGNLATLLPVAGEYGCQRPRVACGMNTRISFMHSEIGSLLDRGAVQDVFLSSAQCISEQYCSQGCTSMCLMSLSSRRASPACALVEQLLAVAYNQFLKLLFR